LNDRSPRPDQVWNRIPDSVRDNIIELALDEPALSVNAGDKMHRRAGVKMHHGRLGEGRPRMTRHWSRQRHPKLSFPVRSMSLLSRPDLGSLRARRAA
jgi:hypothetical protein